MPVEVILPKVDMDMSTGRISKWFFADGAKVEKGDVLFEIETDKAAMEVDAPAGGVLRGITGKEGIDIAVGSTVAWIYKDGEAHGAVAEAAAVVAENGVSVALAKPGPAAALLEQPLTDGTAFDGDVRATPLARRIAKDAGLDLAAINGSGPHGRIVEKDVEAARKGGGAKAAPAAAPSAAPAAPKPAAAPLATGPSDEQVKKLFEPGSYEEVPHDGMRKTIARRLTEAKQTVPHFYVTVDCELDALLKLRAELNAAAPEKDGKPAYKLSVNDMVIKALALALKAVPDANVSWTENTMLKHKHADVGVAVSIPGGLITPIIRDACHKTLSQISNEMKDMAARAKARKLKPEEYQGGTTAVSNLGMFGVKD
ncbi:dihydrolipoamide acetyltransferase family protein, partial [Bosea sp. RAF48]|uniref:dihydrolipoamide acetyltransferase family protein n=1 Tax=Bosea sp. RAF48 TaxID=3237480 RepID=UPI003F916656